MKCLGGNGEKLFTMFGPRNRGSQTKYRESESQTIPWCPPYKEKMGITPEIVEIDPVLKLDTAYFNQNDVDMVKVFRSKQDWEKYLINSPQDTELQKVVIEELEKAKWRLKEKEIDDINKLRLEAAHKEVQQQSDLIKERMEFRIANAKNRFEEVRKQNAKKYQQLLEREIRRSNFKLKKTHYQYNQRKSNVLNKIYGNQNEIGVTRHKIPIENLCPEATPSSLTDAYMLLENNLIPSKIFKKEFPKIHDCNVPKYYPTNVKDTGVGELEDRENEDMCTKMQKEALFRNSKSLITALISGRALQCLVVCYANVNRTALDEKYGKGSKLFDKGMEEEKKFRISVVEAIRKRNMSVKMNEMIQSVIRGLEGRTISNILDYASKEYFRLHEQNRLLALALDAERERWALEAKEAGRRQEEEQRLRQHEEMYKELMKTHEITSDAILEAVLEEQVEETGCGIATLWTRVVADNYKEIFDEIDEEEDPYRKLEYAARVADRCLSTQSENVNFKTQQKCHKDIFDKIGNQVFGNLQSLMEDSKSQESTEESDEHSYDRDISRTYDTSEESSKSTEQEQSILLNKLLSKSNLEENLSEDVRSNSSDEMAKALETMNESKDNKLTLPSTSEDVNLNEIAENLLRQVIGKAFGYINKYKENAKKHGLPATFLHKSYPESLSESYQFLCLELLKVSGQKSKPVIGRKLKPWLDSIINEATRRMASMFFPINEGILSDEMIDDDSKPEDIFEVDDFYLCAEEENVETEINASNGELSDFEGSSIEYLGVLDEKLHEKLIPKEDKKEKFNTLLKRK